MHPACTSSDPLAWLFESLARRPLKSPCDQAAELNSMQRHPAVVMLPTISLVDKDGRDRPLHRRPSCATLRKRCSFQSVNRFLQRMNAGWDPGTAALGSRERGRSASPTISGNRTPATNTIPAPKPPRLLKSPAELPKSEQGLGLLTTLPGCRASSDARDRLPAWHQGFNRRAGRSARARDAREAAGLPSRR